jgi:prepilin-type N-terminal cleavage/methylation domain-containing protein
VKRHGHRLGQPRGDVGPARGRLGRTRQSGFGFVELLVSLAVFAVGISTIGSMFLYAAAQRRRDADTSAAYELLVRQAETIQTTPYDDIPATIPARETLDPGGTFYRVTFDVDVGQDESTWEDADPELDYNLKRITLHVEWQSVGGRLNRLGLVVLRMKN